MTASHTPASAPINVLLRAARQRRNLTQEDAAERLSRLAEQMHAAGELPRRTSISARQYRRWESSSGNSWPHKSHRVVLERFYGLSSAELGFISPKGETTTPIDSTVQQVTDFATWLETTNVGAGTLSHLDSKIRRIAREAVHGAPLPCFAQADDLLRRSLRLITEGRQYLPQTRELYVITGKLCAVMSWLSSDLGKIADADAYGHTGAVVAEQAGDASLIALVLSAQSKAAFWEGRYAEAGEYAERGYAVAARDSARVLLACQQADAWQALGDVARAKQALTLAQHARDDMACAEQLGGPFECGVARQANYGIAVHLRDRRPDHALTAAHLAERAWRGGEDRAYGTWAQVRIGAAIAHLMSKDVERAEASLRPVLDLPADHRLATLTTRLARQVAPILHSPALRGARPALALVSHIREYCSPSGSMPSLVSG
ncbi:helix-turn-helix domain-containing protein [Sphaerisporangium krabiense]|uniref:helix-turn-helix domain-containing protein n=1 Tax=Sphaerisporangium krabiense TaxID=763782 RepID=UPI001C846125|nr:helix-turn-helix transcriptional regulator [Sphaerisporangium krabiense]